MTKLCLTPNTAKTQVMKVLSKTSNFILTYSTALVEVETFAYLGSDVVTPHTDADIKSRINNARVVLNMLRKI